MIVDATVNVHGPFHEADGERGPSRWPDYMLVRRLPFLSAALVTIIDAKAQLTREHEA